MKKKLMIGLAALALATGIGTAAGIKASASNNAVIETNAASAAARVYLTLHNYNTGANGYTNYWLSEGKILSDLRAYFFSDSWSPAWNDAPSLNEVTLGGVHYGYAEVPVNATKVVFYTTNWDNEASRQTGNLNLPSGNDRVFTINTNNGDSNQGGYWEKIVNVTKDVGEYSASSSTTRIFMHNSGSAWGQANAGHTAIQAWGSSSYVTSTNVIYVLTWFQDDNGTYYGYADIPTDVTGFRFVLLANNDASISAARIWNKQYQRHMGEEKYDTNDFTLTDAASCVCYGTGDSDKKQYVTVSIGGANGDTAGANLMEKVLEAVNTCSDDAYNGWNAYPKLNENFYSHATSAAKETKVTSLNASSSYSVDDHFTGLNEGYTAHSRPHSSFFANPAFAGGSNAPVMTVVVVTLAATIAAAGFVFYRKKHQAE